MGLAVVHAQTELTGGGRNRERIAATPSGVVAGEAVSRVHSLTWWRRGPVEGGVVMRGGHRGSWSHVGVAAERKRDTRRLRTRPPHGDQLHVADDSGHVMRTRSVGTPSGNLHETSVLPT